MNILNRKLHLLEKNVLPELPEEGTTRITWDNGDTVYFNNRTAKYTATKIMKTLSKALGNLGKNTQ